jgi:hypothetical protein
MPDPTISYDVLYEYAQRNRLDYNELCSVVRAACRAQPDIDALATAGWQAAKRCYCERGMAGWSSHKDEYLRAAVSGVALPAPASKPPEDSYPNQTVLHAEGEVGNCLQATIAGVLGWPLDKVPHFALLGEALDAMQKEGAKL